MANKYMKISPISLVKGNANEDHKEILLHMQQNISKNKYRYKKMLVKLWRNLNTRTFCRWECSQCSHFGKKFANFSVKNKATIRHSN